MRLFPTGPARLSVLAILVALSNPLAAQPLECSSGRENLLDVSYGGRIAAASSYHWAASIDNNSGMGDHGLQLKPGNRDTVIYTFRDSKWASFDCLVVNLPPTQGSSVPAIELAVAQEDSRGPYRLIGLFPPRPENLHGENLVLRFPAITGRFLRMRIAGVSAETPLLLGEIRLFGNIILESSPPPLPVRMHYDSNLIGRDNGGSIAKAIGDGWGGVIDGREAFAGPFPLSAKPQAVFALAGGKRRVTGVSVYIPQASRHNLREFEVLAGNDGPEGEFRSLGTFEVQNLRYFHDPMQYFALKPTLASHIWILPVSSHGEDLVYIREIRIHGE